MNEIQRKYDALPDKENYLIAFHGGREFGRKEAMGDRLVIASVPKHETERQSKGVKL